LNSTEKTSKAAGAANDSRTPPIMTPGVVEHGVAEERFSPVPALLHAQSNPSKRPPKRAALAEAGVKAEERCIL